MFKTQKISLEISFQFKEKQLHLNLLSESPKCILLISLLSHALLGSRVPGPHRLYSKLQLEVIAWATNAPP